jgi:rare lipoprotein A
MLGTVLAIGIASYYSSPQPTASGERFNPKAYTCAHKTAPFGTRFKVSYKGRSVVCRVNDRGPFIRGRVLDLSKASAQAIGMIGAGVARVTYENLTAISDRNRYGGPSKRYVFKSNYRVHKDS